MRKMGKKDIAQILYESGLATTYEWIESAPCFSVYHKHEWHCGYDESGMIEVSTAGELRESEAFLAPRRVFYSDMQEILLFLQELLHALGDGEGIIAPFYQRTPFVFNPANNDIYREVLLFLHKNGLRKNSSSGIIVSLEVDWDNVSMIIESVFRDVSQLSIFLPKSKLMIMPNHHFELIFLSKNIEAIQKVAIEILYKYTNLRIWDSKEQGTI